MVQSARPEWWKCQPAYLSGTAWPWWESPVKKTTRTCFEVRRVLLIRISYSCQPGLVCICVQACVCVQKKWMLDEKCILKLNWYYGLRASALCLSRSYCHGNRCHHQQAVQLHSSMRSIWVFGVDGTCLLSVRWKFFPAGEEPRMGRDGKLASRPSHYMTLHERLSYSEGHGARLWG